MEQIDIWRVKNVHRGHWFSPATMRFFSSRVAQTATLHNGKAYFVSSEQFRYDSPRFYTIRVCDMRTGDIDTVGEFQQYRSSQQAKAAIRQLVNS